MDDLYHKTLLKLQAACVKREYCTSDMRSKALKALEGDTEAADRLVCELVRDKFVDDLRYASAFAREKASLTGWGPVKIAYALSCKGIQRKVVDEALKEIDANAADNKLEKVLRTKWHTVKDEDYPRMAMLKFALGRGYNYDQVASLVDRIIREESSEESSDGQS